MMASHPSDALRKLISCEGSLGQSSWVTSWMIHARRITQALGMKALKSLLDVGLYENMSWAKWRAVTWVQNQPRAMALNTYEADIEEGENFLEHVKFSTFWEMVRPCLCKEASNQS